MYPLGNHHGYCPSQLGRVTSAFCTGKQPLLVVSILCFYVEILIVTSSKALVPSSFLLLPVRHLLLLAWHLLLVASFPCFWGECADHVTSEHVQA